jgi:hypothetical protein
MKGDLNEDRTNKRRSYEINRGEGREEIKREHG